MNNDLPNRIRERLDALGKNPRSASLEAGLSDAFVLNILKGKSESPRTENLQKLARVLDVDMRWLVGEDAPSQPTLRAEFRPPPDLFVAKDLPVYGAAEGGPGEMVVSPNEIIDYTFRPEFLLHVKDAYALFVNGTSMEPRYEPGEKVYVHPRAPLVRNKDVILCSEPHGGDFKASIKRLIRWEHHQWYIKQYNPEKEWFLSRKEWPKAYRVFGRIDF